MSDWHNQFARSLEFGTSDLELLPYVFEIITWFGAIKNGDDAFASSLIKKYGEHGFRQRFEEFIDRLLIAEASSLDIFPMSLGADAAKKRYRQLIRIFHPDRGAKDEVWLNHRAERINSEYEYYCSNSVLPHATAEDLPFDVRRQAVVRNTARSSTPPKAKFRYRPSVWRNRLGDAKSVQRKMLFLLLGFSGLIVLIVFASSRDIPRQTRGLADRPLNEPAVIVQGSEFLEPSISDGLSESAKKVIEEADWLIGDDSGIGLSGGAKADDFPDEQFTDSASIEGDTLLTQGFGMPKDTGSQVIKPTIGEGVGESDERLSDSAKGPSIPSPKPGGGVNMAGERRPVKSCQAPFRTVEVVEAESLFVTVKHANLRSFPSVQCDIVTVLSPNTHAQKLRCSQQGDWCFVAIVGEGQPVRGWISSELLNSVVVRSAVKKAESTSTQSIKSKLPKAEAPVAVGSPENDNVLSDPQLADVIKRYKRSFEAGSAPELSDLYLSSARENKMRGVKEINRYYRRAFKITSDRSIDFTIVKAQKQGDNSAILNGVIRVGKTMVSSGKSDVMEVSFRLVMLKAEGRYKIAVFDWLDS